jgi:hypothetical protein
LGGAGACLIALGLAIVCLTLRVNSFAAVGSPQQDEADRNRHEDAELDRWWTVGRAAKELGV